LPNTDRALTVEQFHRLVLNCDWHSVMAAAAPDWTADIMSTCRRQMCFWRRTRPVSRSHSVSAPICDSAPVDAIDLHATRTACIQSDTSDYGAYWSLRNDRASRYSAIRSLATAAATMTS